MNTDFDGLASVMAAKKLHPDAQVVLTNKLDRRVRAFLNIYRDTFNYVLDHTIDWSKVSEIFLVDVASFDRIGHGAKKLNEADVNVTIYDHHPPRSSDIKTDQGKIDEVGATVTLLIEEIQKREIKITPLEATLFGLGIYTDTGFFIHNHTTGRDLQAASYLRNHGLNLNTVRRFTEQSLLPEQQQLLDELFHEADHIEVDGLDVVISSCETADYIGGLSIITEKLLPIKGADAILNIVKMNNNVFIVGRATSERVSLLPLLKRWGGGGHRQAGSARVRNGNLLEVVQQVKSHLQDILMPAITAKDIMTTPVKTIPSSTSIDRAGELMYRYGHSGYPVVDDGELVGLITRRDLDKASHHGLGHAPVKAYMSTQVMTIGTETTLEEIHQLIIDHNIGRLPVLEQGEIIGIISRTNIIEAIHSETIKTDMDEETSSNLQKNIHEQMVEQLPDSIYTLLQEIGSLAQQLKISTYLVGGIVRDIFLNLPNDDIDIVVEGNGIYFAEQLQESYGGELVTYTEFGTATWTHPEGLEIDIASSRLEYYERPASLPDVETSTLDEDLYRRDFTINAMAVYLNADLFGNVVDPFSGQSDLLAEHITVLHNLSFVEDPTRILRAVRFEGRFDFKMDEQTESLALHSIDQMKDLSKERLLNDVKRLFQEVDPSYVVERLFSLNFWQTFRVPEHIVMKCTTYIKDLEKTFQSKKVNENVLSVPKWFMYFVTPFYFGENLSMARRFALTKDKGRFVKQLQTINRSALKDAKDLGTLHRLLVDVSDDVLLFISLINNLPSQTLLQRYFKKRQTFICPLKGKDLIEAGLAPGPYFSEVLFELEVATFNGIVKTKEEALAWVLDYVKK